MKRFGIGLTVMVLALGLSVGAAFANGQKAAADAAACVLLPDTKSSVRWETQDRRFLGAAFKKAGVTYNIVNAEGSAQTQRSQADQCLTNGAKVILMVNLDSGSGAAIQRAAKAKGAKTIDYDRLTLNGAASYYVSFDNVQVGKLMGSGIVTALRANGGLASGKKPVIAYLNGGPTDNNATLFKQGYASVIDPLFKSGQATKGPDQAVPGWDNQKARTIFEQMLVKTSNKIDAVAAANDGLGNAVVTALKAKKLKAIPVSGQDATAQGVQNVLAGDQAGTVYKSIKAEADAAAALAISLIKGTKPAGVNGKVNDGKRNVPSALLTPVWVTKANYTVLFKEGFLKKGEVCRGTYAKFC
ncbi:MAG: sugar ABC transporter substrate-binding protein [Gaiella sp.]